MLGLLAFAGCPLALSCSDATHTVATVPSGFVAPLDGQQMQSGQGGGDGDGVGGSGGTPGGEAGNVDTGPVDTDPVPVDVPGETGVCDHPASPGRIDVGFVVDTYITLPLTGSLDRALDGIASYVDDSRSAGTGAGTIFVRSECDPDAYDPPDARVDLLPGHAAAIKSSFPGSNAATFAPMAPAVASAVAQARARARANPERKQIIVLVSDPLSFGVSSCGLLDDNLEAIALDAFEGTPSIPVYVVQLSVEGPGIPILPDTPLDATAQAGGTVTVRIASLTQANSMEETLHQIRTEAQPCEYAIPDPTVADETTLVLNYRTSPVDPVDGEGACGASTSGFYYDDPSTPTTVIACPWTCGRIVAGGHESVYLRVPKACPPP